jgi:hypothetical protein
VLESDIRSKLVQNSHGLLDGCMSSAGGEFEGESADWLTHQWDLLQQQQWFRGFCKRKDAEKELRSSAQGLRTLMFSLLFLRAVCGFSGVWSN